MKGFSDYDYLCDEPYFYEGIGYIKCPTLREIRHITYYQFNIFLNYISMNQKQFLEVFQLTEKFNSLSDEEKEQNTIYNILTLGMDRADFLEYMIDFFIVDEVYYDKEQNTFFIGNYKQDKNEKKTFISVGFINDDNFDDFRGFLQVILGMKSESEVEKPRYKNILAQKIAEKLAKHQNKQKEKQTSTDENFTLPNMIVKYCTHNKVGINIINVWDMTYYQFTKMFLEYRMGRQADVNDAMAANSFSFKSPRDYKPMDYMNKIK